MCTLWLLWNIFCEDLVSHQKHRSGSLSEKIKQDFKFWTLLTLLVGTEQRGGMVPRRASPARSLARGGEREERRARQEQEMSSSCSWLLTASGGTGSIWTQSISILSADYNGCLQLQWAQVLYEQILNNKQTKLQQKIYQIQFHLKQFWFDSDS